MTPCTDSGVMVFEVAAISPTRIAVLLDAIETDYQMAAIAGACRAARSSEFRVSIIAGGRLPPSPEITSARNFVYGLIPQLDIAGLVVLGASLAHLCGIDRFRDWLGSLGDKPCITVGLNLKDMPHVYADGAHGVRAMIRHLIDVHNRRRIAYVSGPSEGPEAAERYRCYRLALQEQGVGLDERLIVEQADLGWTDGIMATGALFDKRRFTPRTLEAIVCMNDEMARGVLEALRRRSIAVPEQMVVVGLDDSPSAAAANPPLTAIARHVEQQAYTATRNLIAALEQGVAPSSEIQTAEVVLRTSCGCLARLTNDTADSALARPGAVHTCRISLLEHRCSIVSAMLEVAGDRILSSHAWEERVIDALLRDLTLGNTTHVVREFESMARRHTASGGDVLACHDILTTLRSQVLGWGGTEPETRPILEDLMQEARLVIGRVALDSERNRRDMLERRLYAIAETCHALLHRASLGDLAAVLNEQLPLMGIKGFVVSRFCGRERPSGELEVVARRSPDDCYDARSTVRAQDLGLDASLEHAGVTVIEPLAFGTTPMGIAAFTWGAELPRHYEMLRAMLSAALRSVELRDGAG